MKQYTLEEEAQYIVRKLRCKHASCSPGLTQFAPDDDSSRFCVIDIKGKGLGIYIKNEDSSAYQGFMYSRKLLNTPMKKHDEQRKEEV